MRYIKLAGLMLAACAGLAACGGPIRSQLADAARSNNALTPANSPVGLDVQVGDPSASYANVEFTRNGRYMVWYEGVNGNRNGRMWHCAVNADAGTLNPPDCKGFNAFPATAFSRANVGYDASGPYYVGGNTSGQVVLVRPTGATTGSVQVLATGADPKRIGYYPSQVTDRSGGYVIWVKDLGGDKELQYIDLANPTAVRTIERQSPAGRSRLTPMEIGFFRMVNGRPWVTYGAFDSNRVLQVKMKDLSRPDEPARFVTTGSANNIDPYGFVAPDGSVYMVAGINAEALMFVYKYNTATGTFAKQSELRPPSSSQLANPILASSFEPIFRGGRILGSYQVNDGPSGGRRFGGGGGGAPNGYIAAAFQSEGEIWLADITNPSAPQVKLSGTSSLIRTEPEPLAGSGVNWVFYNAAPLGSKILSATWQLRRSQVPN